MENYVILTDSSCDLPLDLAASLGIEILSLEVVLENGETKQNHEIDVKAFYEELRNKKQITTSAVGIDRFMGFMEPHLAVGKDVLYLGFSSGLSGTFNAGFVASQELAEKYPDRKIYAVNTLCASLGQGLLVYLCAKMREAGAGIEEVRNYAEDNKLHLCHWFTVDDLFFLKRGGRVSAATAVLGTMLSIKPVMHVDNEGHLVSVGKARGRKASLMALVDNMEKTAIDPANQTVFISHGDCLEDAQAVADEIEKRFGTKDIRINYVGPVIGNHTGAGVVALFVLGTER